jgi:cytochrome P450
MLEAAEADPNFPEFDRQQVIDEMKQYLWAGTETTALTLAWSLYLLSMHPEALERIRAEARAVCGDRDPNGTRCSSSPTPHGDPGDHAAVPHRSGR